MRACPEHSRRDGFAAKATPTTKSHVYVIIRLNPFNYLLHRLPERCALRALFCHKLFGLLPLLQRHALKHGQPVILPAVFAGIISRARYYGSLIGAEYGEPFFVREMNRVEDLVAWTGLQGLVG